MTSRKFVIGFRVPHDMAESLSTQTIWHSYLEYNHSGGTSVLLKDDLGQGWIVNNVSATCHDSS
jgi:hypothetical protein